MNGDPAALEEVLACEYENILHSIRWHRERTKKTIKRQIDDKHEQIERIMSLPNYNSQSVIDLRREIGELECELEKL